MVSVKVTPLFNCILLDLTKRTVSLLINKETRINQIRTESKKSMMKLSELRLSTHFKYNGQIYTQTNGAPMGSC